MFWICEFVDSLTAKDSARQRETHCRARTKIFDVQKKERC